MTKCKNCSCDCHCNVKEHSDLYGICICNDCDCREECEVCQQIQINAAECILEKKNNLANAANLKIKTKQNRIPMNILLNQRSKMNKLFLMLALLFALSACSVGQKCTYTQDGTKLSSWVWFYGSDKPIDLDKNNCN